MSICECFIENIKNIYSSLACRINLAKLRGLNFNSGFIFVCSFLFCLGVERFQCLSKAIDSRSDPCSFHFNFEIRISQNSER